MTPCEPNLSPQEWDLVLDLLERERRELGPEIRHTHNRELREELMARQRMIASLIERITPAPVQAGAGI